MRTIMTGSCKKKAVDSSGTENIISDLPRNLIDCILERMPVRDAARTSILSRKWRYIWATHPQLVLDKQFFKDTIKNKPFILFEFVNMINKILLLHSGPILKFNLSIPYLHFGQNHTADIDQWILVVSRNGIKELSIYNPNQNPYKLPSYIFSCPELTDLKLCNCIVKPPHGFRCFRNLISLSFNRITFPANILGTLFSSAPLLESLLFVSCIGIDHYNIHAPKLKVLIVHSPLGFKSISFSNTPNLITVCIAPCDKVDNSGQGRKPTNLIELFDSLPRIVNLTLDGHFLKFLAAGSTVPISNRLPTTVKCLKNLYFFQIDFNDPDQISCALCLLRNSTNLKRLEIIVRQASPVTCIVMEPVLNLLEELYRMDLKLDSLQAVKFNLHKGSRAELLLIKFLLARCPYLERMLVKLDGGIEAHERFRISKQLMQFSRASPKAEIIYLESEQATLFR